MNIVTVKAMNVKGVNSKGDKERTRMKSEQSTHKSYYIQQPNIVITNNLLITHNFWEVLRYYNQPLAPPPSASCYNQQLSFHPRLCHSSWPGERRHV
jgi:hypothetical protein